MTCGTLVFLAAIATPYMDKAGMTPPEPAPRDPDEPLYHELIDCFWMILRIACAELPRLDRLDDVHIEARLETHLPVLLGPVTGKGDRRNRTPRAQRTQQI